MKTDSEVNMAKTKIVTEILIVLSLAALQIWIYEDGYAWPAAIGSLIVVVSWIVREENLEKLGLWPNKANKFLLMPLLALLALSLLSATSRTVDSKLAELSRIYSVGAIHYAIRYYCWAFFQQLILNGYLTNRLRLIFVRTSWIVWCAGAIFASTHLPNPVLTLATFLGGALSSYIFLRSRNLYILALGHVVIGISIYYFLPEPWHHHMRVGPKFYK